MKFVAPLNTRVYVGSVEVSTDFLALQRQKPKINSPQ